ncbi:MAG: M48 family metallopeptidase [Bacteroidales bacterium]|nr:M48 family metallopeptidase [Bacteroidales bacterium]
MEKQIYLQSIGSILLKKSNKAKRMAIRIREHQGVYVTIPYLMSFKSAEEFVYQKYDWIKFNLEKMRKMEAKPSVFSEELDFKTFYHTLSVIKAQVKLPTAHIHNRKIQIACPEERNIEDKDIQEFIKKVIIFTLRKEARYYLPLRVKQLAEVKKLQVNKVFVKNIQTRWGSCSGVNNINLNIHLMRLPHHLIDYVILHELSHTIHKNHGKGFWDFLNILTGGNAKKLEKEMRNYRIAVF